MHTVDHNNDHNACTSMRASFIGSHDVHNRCKLLNAAVAAHAHTHTRTILVLSWCCCFFAQRERDEAHNSQWCNNSWMLIAIYTHICIMHSSNASARIHYYNYNSSYYYYYTMLRTIIIIGIILIPIMMIIIIIIMMVVLVFLLARHFFSFYKRKKNTYTHRDVHKTTFWFHHIK